MKGNCVGKMDFMFAPAGLGLFRILLHIEYGVAAQNRIL